ELITRALDRHATRQIALHDGAAGIGDRIDAAQEVAAGEETAANAERQRNQRAGDQRVADDRRELPHVLDIAADHQDVAAGQLGVIDARLMRFRAGRGLHIEGEFRPARLLYGDLVRHRYEIAGGAHAV